MPWRQLEVVVAEVPNFFGYPLTGLLSHFILLLFS